MTSDDFTFDDDPDPDFDTAEEGNSPGSGAVESYSEPMTKRDARKIATIRAASMMLNDEGPPYFTTLGARTDYDEEEIDRVVEQQEWLGYSLLSRYDLEPSDLPTGDTSIREAVLNGSL